MTEKTVRFVPKDIPYLIARFLSKSEQELYEEACQRYNVKARETLNVSINGSNLFKVLLLNQIGIRTATMPELDQIIQADDSFLRGTFEDAPSVVLRSNGDFYEKNDYFAKSIARLIRKRKFDTPIVVNGLKIVGDKNSPYGLGFKEGKNFHFFEAPELSHSNDLGRFSRQDERGMPIFADGGSRILYTKPDGLSRLCLRGDLCLYSNEKGLAFSGGYGGVVVVSAKGTSPKRQTQGGKK